jgi:hypothetical protein
VITFEAWPKTPRLNNGGTTITEKIDGTNAAVVIIPVNAIEAWGRSYTDYDGFAWVDDTVREDITYVVGAQSRKRLIRPGDNNAGFAAWVNQNVDELVDLLGPGRHFGEWWGQGIQRRYGMDRKVFSLFNTYRWGKVATERLDWHERARNVNMSVVPLLYAGKFSDNAIWDSLLNLKQNGSYAAAEWGFSSQPAEGIVIHHKELGGNLKVLLENDDIPKGVAR